MPTRPNVALVSMNKEAYSETFIHFHRTRLNANVFYLYQGVLPEKAGDEVFHIYNSPIARKWASLRRTYFASTLDAHEQAIADYLLRNKIDIILVEYGISGAAMVRVSKETGIPLIVFFHGFDAYSKATLSKVNYRPLFQHAARIFAVSKHMMLQLVQLGCPPEKLVLNPCSPDDSFFDIHNNPTGRNFYSVGRFVAKKAPHFTIAAFAIAVKKYPDATLTMVGKGPLLEKCQKLVEKLGIRNNVIFLGVCPPAQIRHFYETGFAYVQHSVVAFNGDREGTSISVNEAGAAGMPVVATFHGGIQDAVLNEETGLLVKEGDVAGMAKAMLRLLDNPGFAASLGAAAKDRLSQYFNLKLHLKIIEDTIERVLHPDGPPAAAATPGKFLLTSLTSTSSLN